MPALITTGRKAARQPSGALAEARTHWSAAVSTENP